MTVAQDSARTRTFPPAGQDHPLNGARISVSPALGLHSPESQSRAGGKGPKLPSYQAQAQAERLCEQAEKELEEHAGQKQ
ncbi:hypothetical protein GGTG_09185 [Gaeumannomyces tritici R3-111a-1]|uniref:Uncharacterized protein n=1 Tax=Gaeumannomyces tritici (strain R3-111a-1) TaxID=644352 RepID=J3P6P3_GAET3|nr:hypothetical protein GGTG_09185 [Gaeumannomyces tritici R3-111a-1]EJT72319.1 hypothetical protein GGTG_09185 [Gaeumannomyces tritici R3-111a-1]